MSSRKCLKCSHMPWHFTIPYIHTGGVCVCPRACACVRVRAVTAFHLKSRRVAGFRCVPIGPACVMSVPSHFLEDVTVSGNYQHFPYGSANSPQKEFSLRLSIFPFQSSDKPIHLLMKLPECLNFKPTELHETSFAFGSACVISFAAEKKP